MNLRTGLLLLFPFVGQAQVSKPYFQQRVDTKMSVLLDDKRHFLHGFQTLIYTNNSPDTLREIYVHLWPNAYKHDRTAFSEQQLGNRKTNFYFSKKEDRGYIDSLAFKINDQPVNYYSADASPDIARIDLINPLLPGQSLTLSTPFRVKIPAVFSRLGHTGQAYFISQWFPKPAVYDREGWHPMPYLDQGEFFADPGRYEVDITLPENYVVMATGNLETPSEQRFMDSLSRLPDPVYKYSTDTAIKSSSQTKNVRFTEDNVHDFAWFADKRFVVRKDSFRYANGHQVETWVAFLPGSTKYWKNGNRYLKAALQVYGDHLGPYPYKTIKGVEGDMKAGGGMEYPTVTVIDRAASSSLERVLIHEAGHNWFQGILASNERRYPWMDEGMNTFYEWKTLGVLDSMSIAESVSKDTTEKHTLPRGRNDFSGQSAESILYYQLARTGEDQALNLTSTDYRDLNYGGDVYMKTALWMNWLEAYMGAGNFKAAMQEYYQQWQFRHPAPKDLLALFRKHTNKDISWFTENAFTEERPVDFSLRRSGRNAVSVKNKGSFSAPALIQFYQKDSLVKEAWTPVFTGTTSVPVPEIPFSRVALSQAIPDAFMHNNTPKRSLGIGLAGGFGMNEKSRLFFSPALGYNSYDGLMAGVLLNNIFHIPESPFRFVAAPLFSMRTKKFVGAASMGYFWYPHTGPFREVLTQIDFKTFHHNETIQQNGELLSARYLKTAPEISAVFREKNPRSSVTRTIRLRGYHIREEGFNYVQNAVDSQYYPQLTTADKGYFLAGYQYMNDRVINPFRYSLEAHGNDEFIKLLAEANLQISYHNKAQGLSVRAFAGKIFTPSRKDLPSRYALQASYTGANDYLYDGTYLGRTERYGIASHQVGIREGGLKIPTPYYSNPLGASDNWLAGINLSTTLPLGLGKLPIELFFDAATFSNAAESNPSGSKVLYDGGVLIRLPGNFLTVYYPFLISPDLRDYNKSIHGDSGFQHTLMFSATLHPQNWLQFTRRALKSFL